VVYDFLSISAGSSRGGGDFESLSQDVYGNIGKSRGRPPLDNSLIMYGIWFALRKLAQFRN